MHPIRKLLAVSSLLAILPALASAASVTAVFDLSRPETGPFPSNRFAAADLRHRTGLRVNLPRPDCTTRPSDCEDVDVLNTLDGFSLQPRLAIPFTGPIDPASVNSANLFLVGLGDTTRAFAGFGTRIGINQIVWDPASNTLFAESDALLEQHTTYVLVATNGIRDAAGDRVETSGFRHPAGISSLAARLYRTALVV
ncbi:MAG TPA: Ig-like domain-containing protein, partial [Steroidobacteraceae bacterium]|nr:Ig-like domain-containing protein [Steroidobacteraceae bacterium]